MGEAIRLPAAAIASVYLHFLPPTHARPTYKPSVDLNYFRFIISFEMFHSALFIGTAQLSHAISGPGKLGSGSRGHLCSGAGSSTIQLPYVLPASPCRPFTGSSHLLRTHTSLCLRVYLTSHTCTYITHRLIIRISHTYTYIDISHTEHASHTHTHTPAVTHTCACVDRPHVCISLGEAHLSPCSVTQ